MEIKTMINDIPIVENVRSDKGNKVLNQFIIKGKDWTLLQSYDSPIVLNKNGQIYLFKDWDYSVTTGRYRNDFLREGKEYTLKKLKNEEYIAVDFEV